jgi:hypothetical protein
MAERPGKIGSSARAPQRWHMVWAKADISVPSGESRMPSMANTPVDSYNRIAPQKCVSWARLPSFLAVGGEWTQIFGSRPSARGADRPAPRRAYPGVTEGTPAAAHWFTGSSLGLNARALRAVQGCTAFWSKIGTAHACPP